ncbi:MAG: carboxypeptidase-like regulatory domain-containing protein [Bacteroidota bacterium]
MNRRVANEFQMLKVVNSIFSSFASVISAIPAFAAIVAAFVLLIKSIEDINTKADAIKTGMRANKKILKNILAHIASRISCALMAYSSDQNNLEMFQEVNYTEKHISRLKDIRAVSICRNFLILAQANHTELEDYGILPADITALTAAITAFDNMIAASQAEIDYHKNLMQNQKSLVSQALKLLRTKADQLIRVAADANPEFHQLYFKARAIDDFVGKRRKQKPPLVAFGVLWGIITNAADGSLIEDATVTIVELNIAVTSDEEGIYYFENVTVGTYSLKVTAETYLDLTIPNIQILADTEVNIDAALTSDPNLPTPEPPDNA